MNKNGGLYCNIRGLFPRSNQTKVSYLGDLASTSNAPWIVLTETHLSPQILDAEIKIRNYFLFRQDREGRSHGGCGIYLRQDLTGQVLLQHSNRSCDLIVLKIKQLNQIVINIYRPPDATIEEFRETLEKVQTTIDELFEKDPKTKEMLCLGDFNFNFIKWPSRKIYQYGDGDRNKQSSEKRQAKLLLEFADTNFMEQIVSTPTRGRNILDLCFTNSHSLISHYTTIVNKHFSDHFILCFNMNITYNTKEVGKEGAKGGGKENPYFTKLLEYDFDGASEEDWFRWSRILGTLDFDEETKGMMTNNKLQRFYDILEGTAALIFKKKADHLEEAEKSDKPKNKIPRRVRKLMKQQKKLSSRILHKKMKWQTTMKLMNDLEKVEKEIQEEYVTRKRKVEKEAIAKMKNNPKFFYSYAKKHSKSKSQVGPFFDENGELISDITEICEILRKQYESVSSNPDTKYIVEHPEVFFMDPSAFLNPSHLSTCKTFPSTLASPNSTPVPTSPILASPSTPITSQEIEDCRECSLGQVHECPEDAGCDEMNFLEDESRHQDVRRQTSDVSSVELNFGDQGGPDQRSQTENANSEESDENVRSLTQVWFTHLHILDNLELLPNGASPGPDGVPTIILKRGKMPISRMLFNIMESSVNTGVIPQILKSAFITPVHKGGSMAEPSNFRPISLTSHVIKTFERVQRRGIVNFLELYRKMDPNQHGSREGRSTLSQLLEHHEEVIKILEEGDNVDSIYLDFLKAFDKCDHGILLYKIKKLGISGKLGVWLHSFLSNRTQTVMIKGQKSTSSVLKSGVPQGSVLGPILFLIYISDIGENVAASLKIYVDDSKVKKRIKNETDVEELQSQLEKMYSWETENNMKFNGKKFQVVRYGRNQDLKNETSYFTPEMEEIIERFTSLRDLGIILNEDGTFTDHIDHVCKKVRQKMGWILRTFSNRNNDFMKFTFNSLVQPHIDYCSQLWMPNKTGEMEKIENC